MKKYKLLQSFPWLGKGAIYFLDENREYGKGSPSYYPDISGMKHERFAVHPDWVENNSDWFAPYVFTTEDSVDIYVKDYYYIFIGPNSKCTRTLMTIAQSTYSSYLGFSTEKAAQEYLKKKEIPKPKLMLGNTAIEFRRSLRCLTEKPDEIWTKEGFITIEDWNRYNKNFNAAIDLNLHYFEIDVNGQFKVIYDRGSIDIGCIKGVYLEQIHAVSKAIKKL